MVPNSKLLQWFSKSLYNADWAEAIHSFGNVSSFKAPDSTGYSAEPVTIAWR